MKAICDRESLLAACQLASAAIPAKDLKPILKNLKAVVTESGCQLMATDLEVGVRLDVAGLTVLEPGDAILPAAKLIAILRESRDAEIEISADASSCLVRGPSFEFEMPSEDAAQFPDFPTFADTQYHEIPAAALREMIRRTVFATADETARYSMTGVLWELDGDVVRLVGTDGRRLAMSEGKATPSGGHATRGQTPVVPTKAMDLLSRCLGDDDEAVKVCVRQNEVLFRTAAATVYSRLVEGRFPDYRAVMPKRKAATVSLDPAAFLSAVKQAAIMAEQESRKVAFAFSANRLTLTAQGGTSGRSRIELPLDYSGPDVSVNFNPEYLVDVLKVIPAGGDFRVELIDGSSPAVFRHGETYLYLVMPLA